jgi:superfamily II DNA or RNA helicase
VIVRRTAFTHTDAPSVGAAGTLAQYAGRLHRLGEGKTEVLVYDYADLEVPVLARMYERRLRSYRAMGYEVG